MNNEQPLACDLTAIEDSEREKHKKASEEVFRSVTNWKELSGGYAFRLPTETGVIEKAGSFIARERLCCPFFNFELEAEPDHGPVWLKITGGEGVKSFVKKNIVSQLENSTN